MSDEHILAIDQGTTGTTCMVFDGEASIQGRAYAEFTQYYPRPGWVEHDAMQIWTVTLAVAESALRNAGIRAQDLAAIGITNQRETTVLWQRSDGTPVGPAIVWQDRRTAGICDQLQSAGLEADWQERTGLLIDPYFSATKVHWMLRQDAELARRAQAGDLAFGTIDSWLIWKLTGGSEHLTDYSNASRTMLYNIRSLEWDTEILSRLEIPEAVLPRVVSSSGIACETAPETFFGARVPIAGVAGDQQAALFGQACYGEGLAKNTYGTGSFLLMNTGTSAVLSRERLLTTIAWKIGDQPVEYALEGAIFVTGAALQWLRDGLGILANAAESEDLAAAIPDNDGVYFVPALTGLGAPHWDAYARGTITGITRGTRREHLVRAALESIAYQTADVVQAMGRESGIPLRELRADGGGAVNNFLMQFQADILDVPLEVPQTEQITALGAAYLAGLGVGLWQDRDDLDARWRVSRRYDPDMDPGERQRLLNRWHAAVERSRGWAKDDDPKQEGTTG